MKCWQHYSCQIFQNNWGRTTMSESLIYVAVLLKHLSCDSYLSESDIWKNTQPLTFRPIIGSRQVEWFTFQYLLWRMFGVFRQLSENPLSSPKNLKLVTSNCPDPWSGGRRQKMITPLKKNHKFLHFIRSELTYIINTYINYSKIERGRIPPSHQKLKGKLKSEFSKVPCSIDVDLVYTT